MRRVDRPGGAGTAGAIGKESVLHYIWEQLRFEKQDLRTRCGEAVRVLGTGIWNRDQGPDFLRARLRLGSMGHFGDVELHLDGEDWFRHGHHRDPGYNSVVLHVVERASRRAPIRQDGTSIPEVVLGPRIADGTAAACQSLLAGREALACAGFAGSLPATLRMDWMAENGRARLARRCSDLLLHLEAVQGDWEQVLWTECGVLLGGPVNGASFRAFAEALPWRVVRKCLGSNFLAAGLPVPRVEALMFGIAGLLAGLGSNGGDFGRHMCHEWDFLRLKHGLRPVMAPLKFHRMRPAAFPTLRLAQWAAFAETWPQTALLLGGKPEAVLSQEVLPSAYWRGHTRFGMAGTAGRGGVGLATRRLLLLNVLAPLSGLYRAAHGRNDAVDFAAEILKGLPAENNRKIRGFRPAGFAPRDALDSQGLLELERGFCQRRFCLQCAVGKAGMEIEV